MLIGREVSSKTSRKALLFLRNNNILWIKIVFAMVFMMG